MNRPKNTIAAGLAAIGLGTSEPTVAPQGDTTLYRNVIDLIETFERRSQLAALRSLTGAVQFTMVNTADWMVRKEVREQASDLPTLDERNAADEFTRGADAEAEIARGFGFEQQEDPAEKLKQYSHLYYGLVDLIRNAHPQPFERPQGLRAVLAEFKPRGAALSPEVQALLEAAEMEPGEFLAARDQARERKAEQMVTRKPRILEILETNADCMPMTEVLVELPVHVQLRLATAAWKGIYYSRKQLVAWIASTNKAEDIGMVTTMANDLKTLKNWCLDFEAQHSQILEALVDTGTNVYGITDAERDVKKPRN